MFSVFGQLYGAAGQANNNDEVLVAWVVSPVLAAADDDTLIVA